MARSSLSSSSSPRLSGRGAARSLKRAARGMSHPSVPSVPLRLRPVPAPAAVAGALSEIEGVGWVLAEAVREGGGIDAASCAALCEDLRRVYRVVRSLRAG